MNKIRKIIEKREKSNITILKTDYFINYKNGTIIQNENRYSLYEITSGDNYIYLQSNINGQKIESRLNDIFLKESYFSDSIDLVEFRKKEKILEDYFFTKGEPIIDYPEEKEFYINDIIKEENEKKLIKLLDLSTIKK